MRIAPIQFDPVLPAHPGCPFKVVFKLVMHAMRLHLCLLGRDIEIQVTITLSLLFI